MGSAPNEGKGRGSLKFRSCNSSLITKQLCVAWPGPKGGPWVRAGLRLGGLGIVGNLIFVL